MGLGEMGARSQRKGQILYVHLVSKIKVEMLQACMLLVFSNILPLNLFINNDRKRPCIKR